MHKYRLIGIGCSTTLRVAAWQLNKFCSVEYPTLPRLVVVTAVVVLVAVTLGLRTFAPSTVECKPISHTVKTPLIGSHRSHCNFVSLFVCVVCQNEISPTTLHLFA